MKAATARTAVGFRNILYATDFSAAAANAIPYVKRIAKHYEANLVALNVHTPTVNPMTPPQAWPALEEAEKAIEQEHREVLLRTFEGIPTQVVIEEGSIEENLQAAIEKYHIDLLVIGTRGRTGLGKLLLGSVAEEILRTVACLVLTVGPYADQTRGTNGQVREILFATDFSSETQAAAACAVSLAEEFQARLVFLHVVPRQRPNDLVTASDVAESSMALLRKLMPEDALDWCKAEYFVEQGNPAEKILELARFRESDMIVLGIKPEAAAAATHLAVSTVHKVVAHAGCPVLTIRG